MGADGSSEFMQQALGQDVFYCFWQAPEGKGLGTIQSADKASIDRRYPRFHLPAPASRTQGTVVQGSTNPSYRYRDP